MLQLAFAVLLAGSLITGGLDGDKDKDKKKAQAQQPIESILVPYDDAADEDDPILDTYALGRTERIPIKLWVGYGWARDEEAYDPTGEEIPLEEVSVLQATEATGQRAFVGAQINVINFTNFSVGAGGQLTVAQNTVESAVAGELDSGFGLQNAKVYGLIRGRTLGIHGGYIFDLGPDEDVATELVPAGEYNNSDQVDAWFVGVNFDYPSERFRLFGGIDYFNRDDLAAAAAPGQAIEDDELVVFTAGAGLKISWVEIGAAALLRTNIAINRFTNVTSPNFNSGGGHQGSIAPYLNLSPPALPVAISVKGAFLSEYADYGYSLGGAADLVTHTGFTVTASLGF
jgi:hypothetical protein